MCYRGKGIFKHLWSMLRWYLDVNNSIERVMPELSGPSANSWYIQKLMVALIVFLRIMGIGISSFVHRIWRKSSPFLEPESAKWYQGPLASWNFTLEHQWSLENLSKYLSLGCCGFR